MTESTQPQRPIREIYSRPPLHNRTFAYSAGGSHLWSSNEEFLPLESLGTRNDRELLKGLFSTADTHRLWVDDVRDTPKTSQEYLNAAKKCAEGANDLIQGIRDREDLGETAIWLAGIPCRTDLAPTIMPYEEYTLCLLGHFAIDDSSEYPVVRPTVLSTMTPYSGGEVTKHNGVRVTERFPNREHYTPLPNPLYVQRP